MRTRACRWGLLGNHRALGGRRSFFPPSPPPFPPGLGPAPAASDAKPFCGGRDGGGGAASKRTDVSSLPPEAAAVEGATPRFDGGAGGSQAEPPQHAPHHRRSSLFFPEKISKCVPTPAKLAASRMADVLKMPGSCKAESAASPSEASRQEYREHCVLGWSPAHLYGVVADVAQYSTFLPWCVDSVVHHVRPLDDDTPAGDGNRGGGGPMEMSATLTVGFSFFQEQYTSRVLLVPDRKVQAVLTEGAPQRRHAALTDLNCLWEFSPVPGRERQAEVQFLVSFAFSNPLYSKLVMSNVVTLMTRSFEKQCESLYGPPSCQRMRLATN